MWWKQTKLYKLFQKSNRNYYANKYKCSLLPDEPDMRDYIFSHTQNKTQTTLPSKISFIPLMPPIRNQGSIGSCASMSIARIISYFYSNVFTPAPLYIYYEARSAECTLHQDSGNTLRGVLKSVNNTGACDERFHPYIIENIFKEPSNEAYLDALNRIEGDKILYERATTIEDIKEGLANGYLGYIGIKVTDSMYTDKTMTTGVVPNPKGKYYGGHAVVITAYTEYRLPFGKTETVFTFDNSWGAEVGVNGRFTVTDKVLKNILLDCWMVKVIPDEIKS